MAQEEKIYKLLDSGQCPGQLVRGLEKIRDKDMGSRGMHVGRSIGGAESAKVFMSIHQKVFIMGKALKSYVDRMMWPVLVIGHPRTGMMSPEVG